MQKQAMNKKQCASILQLLESVTAASIENEVIIFFTSGLPPVLRVSTGTFIDLFRQLLAATSRTDAFSGLCHVIRPRDYC